MKVCGYATSYKIAETMSLVQSGASTPIGMCCTVKVFLAMSQLDFCYVWIVFYCHLLSAAAQSNVSSSGEEPTGLPSISTYAISVFIPILGVLAVMTCCLCAIIIIVCILFYKRSRSHGEDSPRNTAHPEHRINEVDGDTHDNNIIANQNVEMEEIVSSLSLSFATACESSQDDVLFEHHFKHLKKKGDRKRYGLTPQSSASSLNSNEVLSLRPMRSDNEAPQRPNNLEHHINMETPKSETCIKTIQIVQNV